MLRSAHLTCVLSRLLTNPQATGLQETWVNAVGATWGQKARFSFLVQLLLTFLTMKKLSTISNLDFLQSEIQINANLPPAPSRNCLED